MSERAKKPRSKKRSRGLNVRVLQETKALNDQSVRVNSYFEKNDPRKRKTTSNKKTEISNNRKKEDVKDEKKGAESHSVSSSKQNKPPKTLAVEKKNSVDENSNVHVNTRENRKSHRNISRTEQKNDKEIPLDTNSTTVEDTRRPEEAAKNDSVSKTQVNKEIKDTISPVRTKNNEESAEKNKALKRTDDSEDSTKKVDAESADVALVGTESTNKESASLEPADKESSEKESNKKDLTNSKSTEAQKFQNNSKEAEQSPKEDIVTPHNTNTSAEQPASFSKDVKARSVTKSPLILLPAGQEPTIITPSQEKEDESHFETLALGSNLEQTEPKIIPRDVARETTIPKQPYQPSREISNARSKATSYQHLPNKNSQRHAVTPRKLSAKEIKEQEIKKAINSAKKLPSQKKRKRSSVFGNFGWARLTLMITCATTAVFAFIYFISSTSSDVSLKVAASQSGIEASYPDYIPRGYELSDITSASGKVTMNFKNSDGEAFTLVEESSTWDSNALLNNYIRENYEDDSYAVVVEQGLTIYMGNSWEAWVNGGILYKLNVTAGSLTKKQLKTIATSV